MNFETVSCPLCGSAEANPLFEWRNRRMVRCLGCSLVYRNPRPTASDVREAYAAERADWNSKNEWGIGGPISSVAFSIRSQTGPADCSISGAATDFS